MSRDEPRVGAIGEAVLETERLVLGERVSDAAPQCELVDGT